MAPGSRRLTLRSAAQSERLAMTNASADVSSNNIPTSSQSAAQSERLAMTNASADVSTNNVPTSSRKGRGKAKCKALTDHIEATGVTPRIEIPLGFARPVGRWSKEFVSEVGIICRTFAPLSCSNWRLVKKQQRKLFHDRIRAKFDIDLHLPHVEKAINMYLGQRFKDFRCRLHQYYKRLKGDNNQRRRHPYEGVSQEHWNAICDRFESTDFQKLSEKNSTSRQRLQVNHCAGSKSFVRYREELRDAETQLELGRIEFYRRTHYAEDKDGGHWTSPLAKQNYEEMMRLKSQPIQEGSNPLTEDEICDHILGSRPGYINGLGHGKVAMVSAQSSWIAPEMLDLTKRAEEAEKMNEQLKSQVLAQDRKIEEMQASQDQKMGEMQQNMTAMSAKLEAFMLKFGGDA